MLQVSQHPPKQLPLVHSHSYYIHVDKILQWWTGNNSILATCTDLTEKAEPCSDCHMYIHVHVLHVSVPGGSRIFFRHGRGGGPSEVFCLLENKVVRLSNFTIFEKKKIVLTLLIKLKVIKALTGFELTYVQIRC